MPYGPWQSAQTVSSSSQQSSSRPLPNPPRIVTPQRAHISQHAPGTPVVQQHHAHQQLAHGVPVAQQQQHHAHQQPVYHQQAYVLQAQPPAIPQHVTSTWNNTCLAHNVLNSSLHTFLPSLRSSPRPRADTLTRQHNHTRWLLPTHGQGSPPGWKDADKLALERDNWRPFSSKIEHQLGMTPGAVRFLIVNPDDPNPCPSWQMYPNHYHAWKETNQVVLSFLREVLTVMERGHLAHCALASDGYAMLCYRHLAHGLAGQVAALKCFASISYATDPKMFSATTTMLTETNKSV
ncbi:hypothetical protein DFH09DRAFT_1318649 [Mycena vulgaris]|nr:hypothetical protein DFH09DRAFT_1318649 [Mycena vulgaris]